MGHDGDDDDAMCPTNHKTRRRLSSETARPAGGFVAPIAGGSGSSSSRPSMSLSRASSSTVEDDFDVLAERPLGAGSFATVTLAKDKATGHEVAVKHIHVSSPEDERLAMKELELTRRVSDIDDSHTCVKAIAGYRSHAAAGRDGDERSFDIVFDLMKGGSLEELIQLARRRAYHRQDGPVLPEKDAKTVMSKVLSGIATMHEAEVAHFDIKLANILLETPGDWSSVHICDLGLAQDLRKSKTSKVVTGTPMYFAPELVNTYVKGSSFGKEVDLWAAGVVMYELLSGSKPFPSLKPDVLFCEIYNVELRFAEPAWQVVSPEARQLVTQLLTFSPKRRLRAKQALDHAWFGDTAVPKDTKNSSSTGAVGQLKSWLGRRCVCIRPEVDS